MTVTSQINFLNRKIKQSKSQYDLDKKAAEISALSSTNLDKYEYLTCEDLYLKPSTVENAKFEYSPLGKVFNKGLSEGDKKEWLLKKLKNIEDESEQFLKIQNKTKKIKEVTHFVEDPLSPEAKALTEKIRTIQKDVDNRKLKIIVGNKVEYDFSDFKAFNKLFRDLYYKNMIINDAEMKQNEFNSKLDALNNYSRKAQKYIEAKNSLINNAKNFYEGREKIIKGFKEKIFPIKFDDDKTEQQTSKKSTKTDVYKFNKQIIKEETEINKELFKEYFRFQKTVWYINKFIQFKW